MNRTQRILGIGRSISLEFERNVSKANLYIVESWIISSAGKAMWKMGIFTAE